MTYNNGFPTRPWVLALPSRGDMMEASSLSALEMVLGPGSGIRMASFRSPLSTNGVCSSPASSSS